MNEDAHHLPPDPNYDFPDADVNTDDDLDFAAANLDVRAMELLAFNYIVDYCYHDKELCQDPVHFASHLPTL